MLTNLTNKVNKCGLRMSKLYRPYLQREAAARGLLEVTLSTGGEGKLRVFIIVIIKYR